VNKTAAFNVGAIDAMEKVAKSNLHPRAIAGFLQEGGRISKHLASKFKMSPGEINKASKIQRKAGRKVAVKAEVTRRSRLSQISDINKSMANTQVSRPKSLISSPSNAPTQVTKPKGTGAAETLGL
jgi:hypothetical protein